VPRKKHITWSEALDLYDVHLRASRKSKLTIERYNCVLGAFRLFAATRGREYPSDIDIADLRDYQVGLRLLSSNCG
jgi:hypothetical protein